MRFFFFFFFFTDTGVHTNIPEFSLERVGKNTNKILGKYFMPVTICLGNKVFHKRTTFHEKYVCSGLNIIISSGSLIQMKHLEKFKLT